MREKERKGVKIVAKKRIDKLKRSWKKGVKEKREESEDWKIVNNNWKEERDGGTVIKIDKK